MNKFSIKFYFYWRSFLTEKNSVKNFFPMIFFDCNSISNLIRFPSNTHRAVNIYGTGLHLHPSTSVQQHYHSCHTVEHLSSEYTIRYLIHFSAVFDLQFFNCWINTRSPYHVLLILVISTYFLKPFSKYLNFILHMSWYIYYHNSCFSGIVAIYIFKQMYNKKKRVLFGNINTINMSNLKYIYI